RLEVRGARSVADLGLPAAEPACRTRVSRRFSPGPSTGVDSGAGRRPQALSATHATRRCQWSVGASEVETASVGDAVHTVSPREMSDAQPLVGNTPRPTRRHNPWGLLAPPTTRCSVVPSRQTNYTTVVRRSPWRGNRGE